MKQSTLHTIIVAGGMVALAYFVVVLILGFQNVIIIDCAPGYHLVNDACVLNDPVGTPVFVTLGIGQASPTGLFTLNGVFTDRVTGLQCYEYPVGNCAPGSAQYGVSVSMTIGQQVSNGCTVTLRLESINYAAQQATFMQTIDNDPNKMCPICYWQLEAMDETTATRQ